MTTTGGASSYLDAQAGSSINATGSTTAINITASGGANNVCVNSATTITGATAIGILVTNTGTGFSKVYNSGAITAPNGISISGDGVVSITNTGAITASSNGIVAKGYSGSGAVSVYTSATGTIAAHANYGIFAYSGETGGINVTEKGGVTGNAIIGVDVYDRAASGNVSVTITGNVTVAGSGFATGVYVHTRGNGSIVVTGSGSVSGANGIKAGINGLYSGDVTVDFSGNVTASGSGIFSGVGIAADSGGGAATAISHGTVHAGTFGVVAGNSATSSTAAVNAKNYGSVFAPIGVQAWGGGSGAVNAANYGYVKGSIYGVEAIHSSGNGTTSAYNTGTIHMTAGAGMLAEASGPATGAVSVTNIGTIDPGLVGEEGVIANASSSATLSVNNFGSGALTFGTVYGMEALNHGTGLTVVNNGGWDEGGVQGVHAVSYGGGNITINNTATGVMTANSGAAVYASTSGAIHINNAGEIFASTGLAISTTGGATTVVNSGGLFGHVTLSANSTLTNSGAWATYGDSTFAAGTNVINNSGFLQESVSAPTTVTIFGLTTFNNSGDVELRNGHAGDQLWLGSGGGATWNGLAGSKLGIDADLTTALVSDQLVIGAATGSTVVTLHDTAPGSAPAVNIPGARAVWALSGTGAFTMATYHKAFVDYQLIQRGFSWMLVGLPGANTFEMLKLPAQGQDFWRRTGDVWSAREQEVRDGGREPGWQMWAQAFGGGQRNTRPSQSFTIGGIGFSPNLGTNDAWRGFQMGGDQLTINHWLWGFTGGYMEQGTRFRALEQVTGAGAPVVHDGFDLTGWNTGVYGGFSAHNFFMNGLLKGDWFAADVNMPSAGVRRDVDGNSWGAKGELGFRWGGPHFWFEPLADVDWVSTHLDSVSMAGATFNWNDASSSKGEVGARVGAQTGSTIAYVGLYAVDQWSGSNRMNVLYGGPCPSCVSIEDRAPGSYGKADFGLTLLDWRGLEGFLKGDVLFGSNTDGYAARMGVRWRW
jgi:hypothetical protein